MVRSAILAHNKQQQLLYRKEYGINVDIQKLGQNKDLLTTAESETLREVSAGVWIKTSSQTFSQNNFTNIYDLFWDQKSSNIVASIDSSNESYYLKDQVKSDDSVLAAINGAFYFLTDVSDRAPLDLPYDLCIRNGRIFGLPSNDKPIVYVRNNKLYTREPRAQGVIQIGNTEIFWVGKNSASKTHTKAGAVLYNSRCSDIIKSRDPKTNLQIGILDNKRIFTPRDPTVVDLVITLDEAEGLVVSDINKGGGTHYYDGLFILQLKKSAFRFQRGNVVTPLTLDGLNLKSISAAITIGSSVQMPFFLEQERVERQDARSIIAKDNLGHIHLIVFDGSKYIPGFNGVSAKDITPYFSNDKFKWAYFLDGGGSSRLIVREKK